MTTRNKPSPVAYILGCATLLIQFQGFFVQIALPDIQTELGSSFDEVTRIVTLYMAGAVIAMLFTGKSGQLVGFRNTFTFGVLIAALSSFLCSLLNSLPSIWIFRFLQGVGSGFMGAACYSLLPIWVPKEKWGWGFGIISQGAGLGMILGLPLGGLVIHYLDWRSLFMLQACPLLLLALFSFYFLPADPSTKHVNRKTHGIPWTALPINRMFGFALFSILAFNALTTGIRYLIPFYSEQVLGLNSVHSSLVLMLFALAFILCARLAGKLADHVGSRRLMLSAYIVSFCGTLVFVIFSPSHPLTGLFVLTTVLGASLALFTAPSNKLAMSQVPAEYVTSVGPILAILLTVGSALGVYGFEFSYQHIDTWLSMLSINVSPSAVNTYSMVYLSAGALYCLLFLLQLRIHRYLTG